CFWFGFVLLCNFIKCALSDQDGFLSLSCGGTTSYVDSSNITWASDSDYVTTGNATTVNYIQSTSSSQVPARFFPDSLGRNCYRLPINNVSSSVLVRAQFVYKNYDGLSEPPAFSVSLGTAISTTINLSNADPWTEEFLWPVKKDTLALCFQSIPDAGFPVLSTLEVRPLPQGAYISGLEEFPNKFLRKSYRINCGYKNGSLRYPLDQCDRIWDADLDFSPFHTSTGFKIQSTFNFSSLKEDPPAAVLQTARILAKKEVLTYNLPLDTVGDYYIILYFAGILPVYPSFNVLIDGDVIQSNYTVKSSEVSALFVTRKGIKNLNITLKNVSFFPQINAIEVYQIVDIPSESSSTTVSALQVIQQSTGLDLGWQDDPCSPTPWDHIGCEGNSVISLELSDITLRSITPTFGDLLDLKTLDLHNTSLAGEIQNLDSLKYLEKLNLSFNQLTSFGSNLESLISLQILDLQNNSLQGIVPDSLGELKDLHLLNLENNKLQGTLPQSLNRESLEVRTSGNLCLSFSTLSCNAVSSNPSTEPPQVTIFTTKKHTHHSHLPIILGAAGGALLIISFISLSVFFYTRRKKTEVTITARSGLESDMWNWNGSKFFSYKEIKAATNNFKEVIGRGGFGSVYLGKLPDGKLVAVKVRFDKTQLGADSFINEVSLLSQIRHQNLVSLEGFCYESKQQILVYEYLPGGSLADHLHGTSSKRITLSWVRRLKIAVDAAKGLDYLHNGSDPRIIHRDVKSSNILLDEEMNAKVCDFGLSKQVTQADATHVTTMVKGTAGYLDPEYYTTQQLTEKSDVYSFGVVLLELICGRESLSHSGCPDSFNLVLWAKPYLQAGSFDVVDETLKGTFDLESMRKAALIAARSVERDASRRPAIGEVLGELKEAYSLQLSYLASSSHMN
ncbi:Non-specific serine/threonine protein kinase, partial [Bertholletia excelsa]